MCGCDCLASVEDFVDEMMDRFSTFSVWEMGLYKACVFALGMLFGIYAGNKGKKFLPLLWLTFIGSFIYLMYRLLICEYDFDDEAGFDDEAFDDETEELSF